MRLLPCLVLFAGCGRVAFDDVPPGDANAVQVLGSRALAVRGTTPFLTSSASFVDVPGARLEFTADSTAQTWVVIISAALSSSSNAEIAAEVLVTVDGVERGYGGAQVSSPANRESYLAFDVIRGGGSHVVQLQLRDASGTQSEVRDYRMVGFSLPTTAESWFADDPQIHEAPLTYQTFLTLDVEPQAPGDYFVLGGISASEMPSSSNVHVRLRDAAGGYWPYRGEYFNHRQPWYAFVFTRVVHLDAAGTFALEANGPPGSIRHAKLLAIRTDAFDAVETTMQLPEAPTASLTPMVMSTLATAQPPEARDYVVLQHLGLDVNSTTFERGEIFRRDGADTASYKTSTNSAGSTAGSVDLVRSEVPVTYETAVYVTDASVTAYARDIVIHALRLKP